MALVDLSYQYPTLQDPLQDDPVDPTTTPSIIRLQDFNGNPDNASIPNAEGNTDWAQYLEWVAVPNTPLESRSMGERVDAHKLDVEQYVKTEGERLRAKVVARVEDRLALSDKDAEAVNWWNGGSPPPPGFNPATDAPYAMDHSAYRLQLYTALSVPSPPTQGDLAEDILQGWHNAFTYFINATRRIDAVIEQTNTWALDHPAADTLTETTIIYDTAVAEFALIETYIDGYTP